MAQEEQLLSSSIVETLKEASAAETRLSYVQGGIGRVKDIDNNDNLNETDYVLTFYIEKLYRDVGILAERLGLPQFKSEITEDFRKSKGQTEMQIEPGDIQLRSQSLARVRSYYHSLAIMTDSQAVTESVREHHAGLHSFRSMRRMEARRRKARALWLRHSQSLASRRQRPSC